jgi:hypothetical protein
MASSDPKSGRTHPPSHRKLSRSDIELLRNLAEEFGFWPATTNPEDIERHRRHTKEHMREQWIAHHREQGHEPYASPTRENPERWECKCDPDAAWTEVWRILTPEQIKLKGRQRIMFFRWQFGPGDRRMPQRGGIIAV